MNNLQELFIRFVAVQNDVRNLLIYHLKARDIIIKSPYKPRSKYFSKRLVVLIAAVIVTISSYLNKCLITNPNGSITTPEGPTTILEVSTYLKTSSTAESIIIKQSQIVLQKDGRYILSDVFVWMGYVYFVTEETGTTLPPVLCSTVDKPEWKHVPCKIEVVTKSTLRKYLDQYYISIEKVSIVNNALVLKSLNPSNSYHIIWEDMIPVISMLLEDGGLPRNPVEANTFFQHQNWTIMLMDSAFYEPLNLNWWKELLPYIQILSSDQIYFVQKLIVGTRGRCAHFGHCTNSTFYPEDSAMVFRNLIAHTHNLTSTQRTYGNSTCRITLVQRQGSRQIINFDDFLLSVRNNELLGSKEVRAVDFGNLSIREQILVADSTDVFVLIHGGALVHATWLPPGAIVVDINPYMYYHRGLINWMRYNLPDLHLGHHLIQINYTEGQYFDGEKLPTNCLCFDTNCELDMFVRNTGITLDIEKFSNELLSAVAKWRTQQYEKPLSNPDFINQVYRKEGQLRANEIQRDTKERKLKGLPERLSCL